MAISGPMIRIPGRGDLFSKLLDVDRPVLSRRTEGDLVIDLIAPDGSSYRLKNSSAFDSADNVITTYTVNLSPELKNGTWRLQVRDVYSYDTGYINSWSLTL